MIGMDFKYFIQNLSPGRMLKALQVPDMVNLRPSVAYIEASNTYCG